MTPPAVRVNLEAVNQIRCRHGCSGPVVVVHVPEGCACFKDPVQALCMQHLIKVQSDGPIETLIDLRVGQK